MNIKEIHRWDITPGEAIRLQKKLKGKVLLKKVRLDRISLIAGVDVSVRGDLSRGAIVVMSFPSLKEIESVTFDMPTFFPYVPGLLSFREGPVILECIRRLRNVPDMFIFDAQGLAHPRGLGLATHLGLIIDTPSIGVAKTRLFGRFSPPGPKKGDHSPLMDEENRQVGAVLRTREDVKPVFVSPGHLSDMDSAIKITLISTPKYRISEPLRTAHNTAYLRSAGPDQ